MKRILVFALLVCIAAWAQHAEPGPKTDMPQHAGPAAEQGAHGEAAHGEDAHGGGHGSNLDAWKWANFALLVGVAGYFAYKKGGAFFNGRTAQIRRDLDESAKLKADAEARYADIDRRLARLGAEIESLRAQAREESAAEGERVRQETEREMAKIRAQAEREIEAASKAAQQDLRTHAAELAIGLAERKIRTRLTPEADAALVAFTARELEQRQEARVS